jgi:hypothetical protein
LADNKQSELDLECLNVEGRERRRGGRRERRPSTQKIACASKIPQKETHTIASYFDLEYLKQLKPD